MFYFPDPLEREGRGCCMVGGCVLRPVRLVGFLSTNTFIARTLTHANSARALLPPFANLGATAIAHGYPRPGCH